MRIKCLSCGSIIDTKLGNMYQCECRAIFVTHTGKPFGESSLPMYQVGCTLDKPWAVFDEVSEEFVSAGFDAVNSTLRTRSPIIPPDSVFALPKDSALEFIGDITMLTDAVQWGQVMAMKDSKSDLVYGINKYL